MSFREAVKTFFNRIGIGLYNYKGNEFHTFWRRPKFADDVVNFTADVAKDKKIAIVLQGPCVVTDNFTVETVKLYRKYYPCSKIIVSTWDDTSGEIVKECEQNNATVVLSKLPACGGHGNLNYQQLSSKAGIEEAKKQGAEFILKCRTDQRLYGPNSLTFLYNMIMNYPLGAMPLQKRGYNPKARLISTSLGTFSNRLYNISDMTIFGYADDVEQYYDYPFDSRTGDIIQNDNLLDYSKQRPGEIFISTHYLENIGHKLQWTIEDSQNVFRKYFIIVDAEDLDIYWPKYTDSEYRWRFYKKFILKQMAFKDWINNLYME